MLADVTRHLASGGHIIAAVVTVPEERAIFSPLAQEFSASYLETKTINSDPALAFLNAANADVAISINWIALIRQPVIDCFAHGILNAHGGDLPRYRGNACSNWAILRDEPRIALCVHAMTPDLDAGPIYAKDYFDLMPSTYIGDVYAWFDTTVSGLFAKALEMIARGEKPTPQSTDASLALRTYPRRPDDSRIDWKQSADAIHRLVRASSTPFAGAFCFLEDGRKVTIWKASVAHPVGQHIAMPGQPCKPIDGDPMIACGDGFLRLEHAEIEGCDHDAAKREINKSVRKRLT